MSDLRPRNALGAIYFGGCLATTAAGVGLALREQWPLWLAGQILLALALVQWFVLLHECGHGILFRTPRLNELAGHVAGFFSFIPFSVWSPIHNQHHRFTGWQDLDPTTATLVPRKLSRAERLLMNFCWRFWVPLFVVIYRVNNFWNPRRVQFALEWIGLSILYGLLVVLIGPVEILKLLGLGVLLSMVFLDSLILSQHTHIPMTLSEGKDVKPYPAPEQDVFTRSLRFPRWFAQWFLVNVNAHEAHHVHPHVPGYFLPNLPFSPKNESRGWRWILDARRLSGEVFLFQNRNQSGSPV
jgi:fatty acid desaturase